VQVIVNSGSISGLLTTGMTTVHQPAALVVRAGLGMGMFWR
jgi:hypothetical protein